MESRATTVKNVHTKVGRGILKFATYFQFCMKGEKVFKKMIWLIKKKALLYFQITVIGGNLYNYKSKVGTNKCHYSRIKIAIKKTYLNHKYFSKLNLNEFSLFVTKFPLCFHVFNYSK